MNATYRNTNWTKRDYETTNVVVCQAESAPGANWTECEETIIESMGLQQLYIQRGVRYWGYL